MFKIARIVQLTLALVLVAAITPVHAQSHETNFGSYVLRSSVSTTPAISRESAQVHGMEREADRAILNVIVYRTDDPQQMPVEARVEARTESLTGVREDIELRPIEANNRVSYTGTFDFVPREVLDFHITAQPVGSDKVGTLTFRERIGTWR